jgi:hypothetical protein
MLQLATIFTSVAAAGLLVSHWLIWNRLQKIKSRLETVEAVYSLHPELRKAEEFYAKAVHERGESNSFPAATGFGGL